MAEDNNPQNVIPKDKNLKDLLLEGGAGFEVELNEIQTAKFFKYMELLRTWNKKINLTSIEEERDIIIKHFIDSLSIFPFIKNEGFNLIDIGAGGGFPGIPLKIVHDGLRVTLLDSTKKKVDFLNMCIDSLNLSNITAIHGRAEDYGSNPLFREKFHISTARAVAALPTLLEYCLPFVKIGGKFIALKGKSIDTDSGELESSKKALNVFGGKIETIKRITLPHTDNIRNIIIVKKFRQTPTKYPRKAGKPSKTPII